MKTGGIPDSVHTAHWYPELQADLPVSRPLLLLLLFKPALSSSCHMSPGTSGSGNAKNLMSLQVYQGILSQQQERN